MTASPDWLPTVGADTAATAISDGIQKLIDSGVLGAASGVLTADPTMLVVGGAIGTLAKTEFVEYSRKADRRLTQFIEETGEDEHAYLTKLAKGICHFLPEGFGDAAIDAARGNPDRLRALMKQYYEGEDRGELDDAVQRMLKGDFEDFSEELCEAFDTDDIYEAQALFLDFRDIIEAQQVQETLETVLDLEGQFTSLEDELAEARKELRSGFRGLLRRDLRDSGFVRVAPVQFDREIHEPEAAWRAGFDLLHVRGTTDAEGEERTSFVAKREGIHQDGRTATEELLSVLRSGEDRLVVGRAGSGKSTVCKSVACEWYDDSDTGAVFYRQSGRGQPFTKQQGIPGSLVKAVRESDGHTLVVVEDAARTETEAVYEAMVDLRDDSVSFLLDTRRDDLERFEERGAPAALETDMQGKIEEVFRNITRYPLNEHLSEAEIEDVFERFEMKTGREVQLSPKHVRDQLKQGGDIGQVLFLSYYLPTGGEESGGLFQDVKNKYKTITGEADESAHRKDLLEFDEGLRQDVALTTALLVAAGIGNYPELIHTLGEKYGHDDETHRQIEELRQALVGWFVYPTEEPDAAVSATTHELWATLYLREEANREGKNDDGGWYPGEPTRFNICVSALYSVVESENCCEALRQGFDESRLLDVVEENPAMIGKLLTFQTLELGDEWPALEPLYQFGTEHELAVPSVCGPEIIAQVETRKGHVCLARGRYPLAQKYYRVSQKVNEELGDRQGVAISLNNLGLIAHHQGDYGDARDYHQQSLCLKRELGDRQGVAISLNNLGTVAQLQGDYAGAREYYQQSLDLQGELDDQQGVADSLNNLGAIAGKQGDYDAAREYFERGLEIQRELDDRQAVADSLNNLGLVARNQGDYDDARKYFEQSLGLKRELGDRHGVANSLNNLGLVARNQGDYGGARSYHQQSLEIQRELGDRQGVATSLGNIGAIAQLQGDYDEAREYFEQSLEIQRELGDRQGVANSFGNLGPVARSQGDYDDARDYLQQSLEIQRELDDRQGVATSLNNLGTVAQSQGDYVAAHDYHQQSLEMQRELGNPQGVANSLGNLGTIAQSQGDYDDAREYFERANEQFRNIGALREAVTTFGNLVDICEQMDDSESAIEWCERAQEWAGSVEQIDISDVAEDFEFRRLQLEITEETTGLLYYHAVGHVCTNEAETALELFDELWSREERFDVDDEIYEFIMSAGVFLAVHERLLSDDSSSSEAEEILTASKERQEQLTPGSMVLFEQLTEEETETTAKELQEAAAEQESEVGRLDLLAAATLLDALD